MSLFFFCLRNKTEISNAIFVNFMGSYCNITSKMCNRKHKTEVLNYEKYQFSQIRYLIVFVMYSMFWGFKTHQRPTPMKNLFLVFLTCSRGIFLMIEEKCEEI